MHFTFYSIYWCPSDWPSSILYLFSKIRTKTDDQLQKKSTQSHYPIEIHSDPEQDPHNFWANWHRSLIYGNCVRKHRHCLAHHQSQTHPMKTMTMRRRKYMHTMKNGEDDINVDFNCAGHTTGQDIIQLIVLKRIIKRDSNTPTWIYFHKNLVANCKRGMFSELQSR